MFNMNAYRNYLLKVKTFNMDAYQRCLLQCEVLLQMLNQWDTGVQEGEIVSKVTAVSYSEQCEEDLDLDHIGPESNKCTSDMAVSYSTKCEEDLDLDHIGPVSNKCTSDMAVSYSTKCEEDLDLDHICSVSNKCTSNLAVSYSPQTPGRSDHNYDCPVADCNFWSASVAECSVTVFDGFVPDTEGKNISSGREVQLHIW